MASQEGNHLIRWTDSIVLSRKDLKNGIDDARMQWGSLFLPCGSLHEGEL